MALRLSMLRNAAAGNVAGSLGLRRLVHTVAQPAPLHGAMDNFTTTSPPLVLPESGNTSTEKSIGFQFPGFSFIDCSMELMAVPKKKVSPHKRGIRNGPKALKPVPVIVRCKVCGRVKLPHFFCCSGIKPSPGEQN
ncbi:unnamed protein product [Coffea canephora]|uniref:Large ribosomal subunit protein bL32m n=1 Tax=Coffea canephora TaxID=49390 RepID=A0A068VHR3_COFCA|nr:unnamed protein product [Coffea canephora]